MHRWKTSALMQRSGNDHNHVLLRWRQFRINRFRLDLSPRRAARQDPDAFINWSVDFVLYFSNLYSNSWPILGKLWEARSRLYRSRILQVNPRLKALDEISKIYRFTYFCTFGLQSENQEKRFWQTSSGRSIRPRSEFKNSAKVRQAVSRFGVLFSKLHVLCND